MTLPQHQLPAQERVVTVSPGRGGAGKEIVFGHSTRGSESVATVSVSSVGTGRTCVECGGSLAARRRQALHCSPACRHRAFLLRRGCARCRGMLVVAPAISEHAGDAPSVPTDVEGKT